MPKLSVWRSADCEIVAATAKRAVEIARSHMPGLTEKDLRNWQNANIEH